MYRAYCVSKKIFALVLETKDDKVKVRWGDPRMDPDKTWYPSEDFEPLRSPGERGGTK